MSTKVRLEIYGCKKVGAEMVLTLQNKQEANVQAMIRCAHLYLNRCIENGDVVMLIISCLFDLAKKERIAFFQDSHFDEQLDCGVKYVNKYILPSPMYMDEEELQSCFRQIKTLFTACLDVATASMTYPIHKVAFPYVSDYELYEKTTIQTVIALIVATLLHSVNAMEIEIHSHEPTSLIQKCHLVLRHTRPLPLLRQEVGISLWLDTLECLKVVKCTYCENENPWQCLVQ